MKLVEEYDISDPGVKIRLPVRTQSRLRRSIGEKLSSGCLYTVARKESVGYWPLGVAVSKSGMPERIERRFLTLTSETSLPNNSSRVFPYDFCGELAAILLMIGLMRGEILSSRANAFLSTRDNTDAPVRVLVTLPQTNLSVSWAFLPDSKSDTPAIAPPLRSFCLN
eukprot:CAMPEP_0197534390 /NCGR_PEP_ID=MMETSP1318-20131121/46980_1 /TAXON_ID=552666 /ORGANISM="Partenskyella glossopodia, Strain RCC365" /LENGTH=166 /DNA_ID=CAMNT_0043091643 /DNA_START=737 /DNA_END=1237 /DNA_ORIENTATION=-